MNLNSTMDETELTTAVRFLGIDPGLNRTGYALLQQSAKGPVLCEGGIIRSNQETNLAARVHEIASGIREVIAEYRPDVMVIEQVFTTPRFPKSSIIMAHARGAILFAAHDAGVPVVHYTPTQIKKLITGSGRASKEQMQHAIKTELGLKAILEPNDVADAFAAALCHYHTIRVTCL
ncbi:crossover junction endodeoxyribonuclease RuvC [Gimesia sp.]|uniref:crossover junction endodeoxyribonuclease RuvC n=1 Tax=Gimesia sp. TaxID=2024833 RepID=UPI0025C0827A|nr:crossover junction endodeoxyribonuclease RuvC [Gimesia sp.]|tara:strand:- start:7780 stop:8310 length:531 start_codon:yes stop_codon:yes gene_type:complete